MHSSPLQEGSALLLQTPDSEQERTDPEFLASWLRDNRVKVLETLDKAGAILFRGFNVSGAESFQKTAMAFEDNLANYIGGNSPRKVIQGKIYNSTFVPPEVIIPPHCEMSYEQTSPATIFFYCNQPSEIGGETPLSDMRKVFDRIDPKLRQTFVEKGVNYKRWLLERHESLQTWGQSFETSDKAAVERILKETSVGFEWLPDGALTYTTHTPGVIRHPRTKRPVWFNQVAMADPFAFSRIIEMASLSSWGVKANVQVPWGPGMIETTFGDGSPISDDVRREIWDAYAKEEIVFKWQRNDMVLIDNFAVAHARRSFKGARQILVAMSSRIAPTPLRES